MVHLDSGDLLTTLGPYWLSPPSPRIVLKVWIRIPPWGFWGRQVMVSGFEAAEPSPPLSFGATAEYYRSGQPRAPLLLLQSALIPLFFLRGASRSRDIETTVKTATAHPAFRLVRSLLKGAIHPSLQVPIERPQLVPVPDCGASVVCEPFSSGRNLSREGHSTLEV